MNTKTEQTFTLRFMLGGVCKKYRAYISSQLEQVGLYLGQDRILKFLWEDDGLSQNELVEKTDVTAATLTRALQRMQSNGLIERRSCPSDARVMRVFLTEKGRQIRTEIEALWQSIEDEVFGGLSLDECETLQKLLLHIDENLERAEW